MPVLTDPQRLEILKLLQANPSSSWTRRSPAWKAFSRSKTAKSA
jgi:hypothetical protein